MAGRCSQLNGASVRRREGQPISDFEFTSVVVSILIAFAFSEILASWGRIIRRRPRVRVSWLYFGVSGLLLLVLVAHWLGMSSYRELSSISPLESALVFLPSFIAAFVAFILAPEFGEAGELDLSEHYFRVAPWVFPLLAAFMIIAGLSDRLVLGESLLPIWFWSMRAAVLLFPAFSKRPAVHATALVLALLSGPVGYAAFLG